MLPVKANKYEDYPVREMEELIYLEKLLVEALAENFNAPHRFERMDMYNPTPQQIMHMLMLDITKQLYETKKISKMYRFDLYECRGHYNLVPRLSNLVKEIAITCT